MESTSDVDEAFDCMAAYSLDLYDVCLYGKCQLNALTAKALTHNFCLSDDDHTSFIVRQTMQHLILRDTVRNYALTYQNLEQQQKVMQVLNWLVKYFFSNHYGGTAKWIVRVGIMHALCAGLHDLFCESPESIDTILLDLETPSTEAAIALGIVSLIKSVENDYAWRAKMQLFSPALVVAIFLAGSHNALRSDANHAQQASVEAQNRKKGQIMKRVSVQLIKYEELFKKEKFNHRNFIDLAVEMLVNGVDTLPGEWPDSHCLEIGNLTQAVSDMRLSLGTERMHCSNLLSEYARKMGIDVAKITQQTGHKCDSVIKERVRFILNDASSTAQAAAPAVVVMNYFKKYDEPFTLERACEVSFALEELALVPKTLPTSINTSMLMLTGRFPFATIWQHYAVDLLKSMLVHERCAGTLEAVPVISNFKDEPDVKRREVVVMMLARMLDSPFHDIVSMTDCTVTFAKGARVPWWFLGGVVPGLTAFVQAFRVDVLFPVVGDGGVGAEVDRFFRALKAVLPDGDFAYEVLPMKVEEMMSEKAVIVPKAELFLVYACIRVRLPLLCGDPSERVSIEQVADNERVNRVIELVRGAIPDTARPRSLITPSDCVLSSAAGVCEYFGVIPPSLLTTADGYPMTVDGGDSFTLRVIRAPATAVSDEMPWPNTVTGTATKPAEKPFKVRVKVGGLGLSDPSAFPVPGASPTNRVLYQLAVAHAHARTRHVSKHDPCVRCDVFREPPPLVV